MTIEKLRGLENSVIEKVCKNLIETVELRKDALNTLGKKPDKVALDEIRKNAIKLFKESIHNQMEAVYKEENIEQMFDKLDEESKKFKNKKGWRPSGDPQRDTYASRRPLLVAEIERLERTRDELADRLKPKIENILELKEKVDLCMTELGGL